MDRIAVPVNEQDVPEEVEVLRRVGRFAIHAPVSAEQDGRKRYVLTLVNCGAGIVVGRSIAALERVARAIDGEAWDAVPTDHAETNRETLAQLLGILRPAVARERYVFIRGA